ncbi:MAG TPA: hypothetical protein VK821_03085 [Dehalococcoidia bacterium]|nr:hypothetical protein [Dehalococcoidia bacterium]
MDRSQTTGTLIMAGAALQLLLFVIGLMRKSYLAIAMPVTGAMAALSALAFWVGWTMLTTPADMPDEDYAAAPDAAP